jgi:hypothetical protein
MFFMFRPAYVEGAHSTKFIKQSIREIFGDTQLGKDTVRSYSKLNFFLPPSYKDLITQLSTCCRALELFTR